MELVALPTRSYHNLKVYRQARTLADDVFWTTRQFPPREQHAMIVSLRHAARSIQHNVAEGWRHRYNGSLFNHHLNGALAANVRLALWLELAYECRYLSSSERIALQRLTRRIKCGLRRLQRQRIALLA